ncbi:MAG: hypothetical protein WAT74_08665 [Flavobacteriales bacterium]
MKTTIELPDDVLYALKNRAAKEGRSMKDALTEILRSALKISRSKSQSRSKDEPDWPIIQSKKAKPGQELTPERIYEILYGNGE